MKKFLIITMSLFILLSLISCSVTKEQSKKLSSDSETYEISEETRIAASDADLKNEDEISEAIGGSSICEVHNFGYHCYPDEIIEYIGEDRFREWSNEAHSITDEEGCWPNGNILICIEHFDVPDAVVIEAYQNDYYNHDWDMEALLARDAVAFERYARNSISTNDSTKLTTELLLKFRLFDAMERKTDAKTIEYFNSITNNGAAYPVCNITIYEMISHTSLNKEDFIKSLESASSDDATDNTDDHFNYDLDLLFGNTNVMKNAVNGLDIPQYESRVKMSDALLHMGESESNHEVY